MNIPHDPRARLALLAVGMMLLLGLGAGLWHYSRPAPAPEPEAPAAVATEAAAETAPSAPSAATQREDEQKQALTASLTSLAQSDGARYSVYVFFPEWQSPLVVDDRQQSSASIIKLYLLGTAYEMAGQGSLSLDENLRVRKKDMVGGSGVLNGRWDEPLLSVRELLRLMITESDNTATNLMIDRLTPPRIQAFCTEHGFTDTLLQRKMMDTEALAAGRDNLTTARDVGEWLRRLMRRELVSPTADAAMEQVLFGQTDTECMPQALPGARIAHKTGELAGVYHDAGIVYEGDSGYVLVLLSSHSPHRGRTLAILRQMAQAVDAEFHRQ